MEHEHATVPSIVTGGEKQFCGFHLGFLDESLCQIALMMSGDRRATLYVAVASGGMGWRDREGDQPRGVFFDKSKSCIKALGEDVLGAR